MCIKNKGWKNSNLYFLYKQMKKPNNKYPKKNKTQS